MLDDNQNSFDQDLHKIKRISVKSSSLDKLRKLHNSFYTKMADVTDFLVKNYGDIWMNDASTTATEFVANGGSKSSLYKKISFLLEDVKKYGSNVVDKETGLLPTYAVIKTANGEVVIRDAFFCINPILLFPLSLKMSDDSEDKRIGLAIEDKSSSSTSYFGIEYLVNYLFNSNTDGKILLSIESMLKYKESNESTFVLFRFKIANKKIMDDIGKSFFEFSNAPSTSANEISQDLLYKDYSLVGLNYYAPLTTGEEIDCILYAELDNAHDAQAIKILRWFPQKKDNGKPDDKPVHELGHISRNENSILHEDMCKSNNRLLFGKVKQNRIRIVGNLNSFLNGEYSSYWLPIQLFKFISK